MNQADHVRSVLRVGLLRRGVAALVFPAGAAVLAVLQLLIFPIFLFPEQFSMVAVGLSVIQASVQFGDLGFGNAAANSSISHARRQVFRFHGLALSGLFGIVLVVATLSALLLAFISLSFAVCITSSAVCGSLLSASKMRASLAAERGRSKELLARNFVWQNIPKVGQLVGAFSGLAVVTMTLGTATALLARPKFGSIPRAVASMARYRSYWLIGFALSVFSFLLMWLDTYVVAFILGGPDAGRYQAIVRPLFGVSYIFLPAASLVQSAANKGRVREIRYLATATILVCGVLLSIISYGLIVFGRQIWPAYIFPADVVVVVAVAVLLMAISSIIGNILLVRGRIQYAVGANLLGALCIAVTAVGLIPHFGIHGAAVASCLSWLLVASVQAVALVVPPQRTRYRAAGRPAGAASAERHRAHAEWETEVT